MVGKEPIKLVREIIISQKGLVTLLSSLPCNKITNIGILAVNCNHWLGF